MPSTYSTNLGIELPEDGELDGLWGDVVNLNMNILDRAINGSVSLTLSGTSSTLTTSDGVLSNGQFKLLVLGGSPSGTHTITISPNDAQKIYFVRNTTAQSVVFTQGSGGNVTVAAGDSGIIYSNGGGASAAVALVLNPTTLSSLGVTASASELNILDGVTATTAELNILDGVTASTAELNILDGVTASTAELNQLDNNTFTGDVTIDDKIVHAGDTNTSLRFPAADTVSVETSGAERLRVASDGNVSVGTTSTFYSAANRTTLSINGVSQSMVAFGAGGSQKGYMYTDGTSIIFGADAGSMTFTVTGAEPMTFNTNNTERLRISATGNVGIGTASPTATLHVDGTVAGTAIASQVEAEAGTATNKLMTPQRTKQAIDALGGGIVLLGTINTTSGSVQTLSGLDLTGYKQVQAWIKAVDPSTTATASSVRIQGQSVTGSATSPQTELALYDLGTGLGFFSDDDEVRGHSITTATTSISVSTTQTFGGGSVTFYGVK